VELGVRGGFSVACAITITIVVVGCSGSDGNADLIGPSSGAKAGAAASETAATTPAKTSKKSDGGTSDDDAGTTTRSDAGSAAECRMASGQAGCDACLAAKCCDPVKACNAASSCQPLYRCLDKCGPDDEACQATCLASHVEGRETLRAVLLCAEERCPTECQ
jgi:hypothetical protein